MEIVEKIAVRVMKEVSSELAGKLGKPAQRKRRLLNLPVRRKRRRLPWLGLALRLALAAGAVYLWWRVRQQAELEQARSKRRAGQGSRFPQASPTPSAAPYSAAGAGAQSTGRAAVQTATRAEPIPGAAGRMAAGEAAPGGIAAAFPAQPVEPPVPAVEPPAETPYPTVLSPAGEVSAEVAPLVPAAEENAAAQPTPGEPAATAGQPTADEPSSVDDLEIIEGIGPRIAAILREQGITTFQQLAEAPLERLQEILRARNLRIANPATWSEQARLAAQGDWSALTALQDTLKGGRRVKS